VKSRISGRYALAIALVLVLGVPAFAVAQSGTSLLGGKRNPSGGREFRAETEIIAQNNTYGTRQSNKTDGDGGGAIYGCRSNTGAEPCIRANNLKQGRAFEFETVGKEAGSIEVGDPNSAPFSTNGKGTVQNLSADALDGRDSASFATAADFLFAAVPANGTGATGKSLTSASRTGTGTYAVKFARDVSACSFTATAAGATPALTSVEAPAAAAKDTVTVHTADAAGAAADTAFQLQVVC
jgi:hypothetical protein